MRTMLRLMGAIAIVLFMSSAHARPRQKPEVVRLWPGQAPGTESWTGDEQEADVKLPNVGNVHVVTNVTVPTLTVFRPLRNRATGTAMIVVPGGAFRALPWDLDGLETARWLIARGITAFVLKYRVRPPDQAPADRTFADFERRTQAARALAIADAEQAVRLIRSRATQFGIAPDRVGMIGFSAGAMTTMDVALSRDASVRPNFAVSAYGAILTSQMPTTGGPPLFIVAAQDDPELSATKSIEIFRRWTDAGLPAELHIYEKGGHAFGFRVHHLPVDHWPAALESWLRMRGYLSR